MKLKIGTIVEQPNCGIHWEVIGNNETNCNYLKCVKNNGSQFLDGQDITNFGGFNCNDWKIISEPWSMKSPKNKDKKFAKRPLYLVASRNGMTHKGIVPAINKKGVARFGNSVLQALSKYEDQYGKKIDLKEAVVFKLVPHGIRIDNKNSKPRIGKEIK